MGLKVENDRGGRGQATPPRSNPAGLPLYEHIKEHIRSQVKEGALVPGQRVPSENELVTQFAVSRMTAHRALRELQQEGLLSRRAGVGTFVREPTRQTSLIDIRNIAHEIEARGHRHSARIHRRRTVKAGVDLAESFGAEVGERFFYLVLVHREDGLPVQLEERYVNPRVVPDFLEQDFKETTPTAFLLSAIRPEELEHSVHAVLPTAEQQRLLDIPSDEPCLSLRRRSWSNQEVVTVAELVYPASRYSLYGRHSPSPSSRGLP